MPTTTTTPTLAPAKVLPSGRTSRAIGYRRISKQEPAGAGLGLSAQASAITAAATRLGLTLAETFTDDGKSGGLALEQRPALLAALNTLQRGDTLIVAKRDRLGRDVLNVALVTRLAERKGARIVSAAGEGTDDDGPTSVLMRNIVDSFAEYERAIIRQRTKAALAVKRSRNERISGELPFGFQLAPDRVHLVPHAGEQHTLRILRGLRAQGYTLARVADELNALGLTTRRGSRWRKEYVHAYAVVAGAYKPARRGHTGGRQAPRTRALGQRGENFSGARSVSQREGVN